MSNEPSLHGQFCACGQQDSSVSSSQHIELETYDSLLVRLLSVRKFLRCSLFPHTFSTRFNIILDELSEAGRAVPYIPPSVETVQSVDKFVKLLSNNKQLFDGIVESTRIGLQELSSSTSN